MSSSAPTDVPPPTGGGVVVTAAAAATPVVAKTEDVPKTTAPTAVEEEETKMELKEEESAAATSAPKKEGEPKTVEVAAAASAPPSKKRARTSRGDGEDEDGDLGALQEASQMMGKMTAAHMDQMTLMQQKLDEEVARREQAEANLSALKENADRMPTVRDAPIGVAGTDVLAAEELARSLADLAARCSGGGLSEEERGAMKSMPKICAAACSRVVAACSAHITAQEVAAAQIEAAKPNPVREEFNASMRLAKEYMASLKAATNGMSAGKMVKAAATKVTDPVVVPAPLAAAATPAAAEPKAEVAAPHAVPGMGAQPMRAVFNPAAHFRYGGRVIEVAAAQSLDPRTQSLFHGVEMVDGMPVGNVIAPSVNTWGDMFSPAEVQALVDRDGPMRFEEEGGL